MHTNTGIVHSDILKKVLRGREHGVDRNMSKGGRGHTLLTSVR